MPKNTKTGQIEYYLKPQMSQEENKTASTFGHYYFCSGILTRPNKQPMIPKYIWTLCQNLRHNHLAIVSTELESLLVFYSTINVLTKSAPFSQPMAKYSVNK